MARDRDAAGVRRLSWLLSGEMKEGRKKRRGLAEDAEVLFSTQCKRISIQHGDL